MPSPRSPSSSPFSLLVTGFIAVTLFILLLIASGALERAELRWLDQQFRWLARHAPLPSKDDIVVVGIDDASLSGFGTPIALLHRQLGGFLEAMAVAKSRAVGLDLVLPERSYDAVQPGLDAALARGILALRRTTPLIVGVGADAEGKPRAIHPLFVNLIGADRLGSVFVLRDADGVVRRFDEHLGGDGATVPTLVGQLARATGGRADGGLIQFAQNAPIPYLPLNRVLEWRARGDADSLQAQFAGKVVLLGSLLAHDDQHTVTLGISPLGSGNSQHGVFVLGHQLRSQMAGATVHPLPKAMAFVVALLLVAAWWLRPGRGSFIGIALLLATLSAVSTYALRGGWALPTVAWSLALAGSFLARTGLEAWLTAAEKRRLRATFDGFVSPQVLEEILAGRLHPDLAGEKRDVCVLFSDIRSFTTLSENLPPEVVTDLLNRYFERMAKVIHAHHGTLDKFIGDGIMAFFGAPQTAEAPCLDAFLAAKEMLDEVKAFNQEQTARGGPTIAIGIGLHHGPAFLGYIGSRERHEYSAIGDTVNTASRLEGLTKDVGCPIVLSAATVQQLPDRSAIGSLGAHAVKGRAPVDIFGWPINT